MRDKMQHNAANLREKMLARYGDELHHKHNKNHLSFRQHCKSHPCNRYHSKKEGLYLNESTGLVREFKLRKVRKRLDKGRYH